MDVTLPPSNGSSQNLKTKRMKVDESNRTVFSAGWKLQADTAGRVNSSGVKRRGGGLLGGLIVYLRGQCTGPICWGENISFGHLKTGSPWCDCGEPEHTHRPESLQMTVIVSGSNSRETPGAVLQRGWMDGWMHACSLLAFHGSSPPFAPFPLCHL